MPNVYDSLSVTKTNQQSFCQSTGTSCAPYKEVPNGVIIVGVLSFLGSRLAAHLVSKGLTIHGIASITDTKLDGLGWYRREQLVASGVAVEIIDFKNLTTLKNRVVPYLSKDLPLVYVPFLDRNAEENLETTEEFIGLLEMVQKWSSCTKVLMISDNMRLTALQKVRLKSLELLLSSYHSVYSIPTVLMRMGGVYGPWSEQGLSLYEQVKQPGDSLSTELCWYVSDVSDIVYQLITRISKSECEVFDLSGCQLPNSKHETRSQSNKAENVTLPIYWDRLHTVKEGIEKTLSWAKEYKSAKENANKRVIFTTYFTNYDDPQRGKRKRPDNFPYISEWYKSVAKLNISAVIFHDGMQPQFQDELTRYHSGISFEFVPSLNGHTTNDGRFYLYLNYLENHPEIDKILLTDVSDVQFQMNPFQLMDLLGEWFYVGKDNEEFPTMNDMEWIRNGLSSCFGLTSSVVKGLMDMDTVFNAGVIGGSRELILTLLTRIVGLLNIPSPKQNCNMPALNIALHRHFFENVFTGFPLTSRFVWEQNSPKGVYIIHK